MLRKDKYFKIYNHTVLRLTFKDKIKLLLGSNVKMLLTIEVDREVLTVRTTEKQVIY